MYFKEDVGSNGGIGAVVGCFKGAKETWAGQSNGEWWKGVLIKRNIIEGQYDAQWVSLDVLKKTYGG